MARSFLKLYQARSSVRSFASALRKAGDADRARQLAAAARRLQPVDEVAAVVALRLRRALRDAAVARRRERLRDRDVEDVAGFGVEVVGEVAGVVEVGDGEAVDVDG